MKVNVQALEIEMTPAIDAYMEKKLGMLKKLLLRQEKFNTVLAKVELGKTTKHHRSGDLFKAEVHLVVGKESFTASATQSDLYAAIDEVKDELYREITAQKDRSHTLRTRGGRKIKKILKGLKKC